MAHSTGNNPTLTGARYPLAILGSVSALALAGCFGGSGSSGNGNDDNGGGESDVFVTLDRLSGLGVDDARDELLFYKLGGFDPGSDESFESGLRAIDPDVSNEPLEFGIQVNSTQFETTTPIISGDWSQSDFDLTGIERKLVVAKISDRDDDESFVDDGVATIETEVNAGGAPENAVALVGEQRFLNAGAGAGFTGVIQSPEDTDSAQIMANLTGERFLYNPGMNDGDTVPSISLGEDPANSAVSIRDIENLEPTGWLTVDESESGADTVLQFLDTDGDLVGDVSPADEGESAPVVDGVSKFGEILPDGSYYLVLTERDADNSANRLLWHYTPDPDGAGTVEPVTDESGEVFDLEAVGGGLLGAQSNRVAYGDDGALFFSGEPGFLSGVEGHSIFRVQGTDLQQVATSGDSILSAMDSEILFRAPDAVVWITDEGEEIWKVSLDGNEAELIADGQTYQDNLYDFYDNPFGGGLNEYSTPVHAASDEGWIFYTATSTYNDVAAVMHNISSGEMVAVDGARWVGSSSDGSLGPAGFLGQGRLSEVFLMKTDDSGDPILGAVDAADPLAGMVELGTLPTGTKAVSQGHIRGLGDKFFAQEAFASGPHRLFRANLDDDQNGQIIYVDVNDEGSLESIVNSASPNSYPVSGY